MGRYSLSKHSFSAIELLLSTIFKYPSLHYLIHEGAGQTFSHQHTPLYTFAKSYRQYGPSREIICAVSSSHDDLNKTIAILNEILSMSGTTSLKELATAEVLAKVVAYRSLQEGTVLPIPTLTDQDTIELVSYTVNKRFNLWNKMRAFGLIPLDRKGTCAPLLLFRGTDLSVLREGGRASLISDLDPKGPGRTLFEQALPSLHQWISKGLGSHLGKPRLIGHSLGGAIVIYMLIHASTLISQLAHQTSYAFNFPGVSDQLLHKWFEMPHNQRPTFKGIVARGDVISKFGKLFDSTYEVSTHQPLSPIRAHEQLLFLEPTCFLQPINTAEENREKARHFYSKLHQKTSSLIYEFGLKFLLPKS